MVLNNNLIFFFFFLIFVRGKEIFLYFVFAKEIYCVYKITETETEINICEMGKKNRYNRNRKCYHIL